LITAAVTSAKTAQPTKVAVRRRLCVSAASTIGTSSRIAMTNVCGVIASITKATISTAKAVTVIRRERTASASGRRRLALRKFGGGGRSTR
jgi:hypothetical protein